MTVAKNPHAHLRTSTQSSRLPQDARRIAVLVTSGLLAALLTACFSPEQRTADGCARPEDCRRERGAAEALLAPRGNPHWFRDANGRAVYLAGHAIHGLYQNAFETVDYAAHLDNMVEWGTNLQRMRLWMHGWVLDRGRGVIYPANPPIYRRSSVGGANDGGNKFDLDAFNEAFFAGLRQRVKQASERGIYTIIVLYMVECTLDRYDGVNFWHGHPWNAANNVNSIGADRNGDGSGHEMYEEYGRSGALWARHLAYIDKVVKTLAGIDGVIFEVGNEMPIASAPFQYQVIKHLKAVSSAPAGMSAHGDWQLNNGKYGGAYAELAGNPGEWLAPGWEGQNVFVNDPPVERAKIIFNDTDHTLGWKLPTLDWIWRAFTRGQHLILMDSYVPDEYPDRAGRRDDIARLRRNLGYTVDYARRMQLADMAPRPDLTSSGYALAAPGEEYLVFKRGGGLFSVALETGSYAVEWLRPRDGALFGGGTIAARGGRIFKAPFSGDAVLYLRTVRD
jgi:hypothetical protein